MGRAGYTEESSADCKCRSSLLKFKSDDPQGMARPTFSMVEDGKQVTLADTADDFYTCLALANGTLLPNDKARLKKEYPTEVHDFW